VRSRPHHRGRRRRSDRQPATTGDYPPGRRRLCPAAGLAPGAVARPIANSDELDHPGSGLRRPGDPNGAGDWHLRLTASTLEVRVDDDAVERVGSLGVSVVNPAPGGGVSNVITVLITENPRPAITGLSATSARAGSGDLTVTIRGRDFTERAVARVNGLARRTTVIGAAELRLVIPAADLARAGLLSLSVANPAPGGGVSNTAAFTVTP
jgi:hypothetical protein